MKKIIKELLIIAMASVIYAAGIALFLDPNNLAPGGVTGISIILNRLTGISTGTLYFMINGPLVLLGLWKLGWKVMAKTALCIVCVSTSVNFISGNMGPVTTDPLLASVAGGVLVAAGIAFVFKSGATTGGMDIPIKIIRQKNPHLKTGFLFRTTDFVITIASGFVFKNVDIVIYALICVFISGKVMDYLLYGSDEARMLFVISDRSEEITRQLLEDLDTGVTYLKGIGGYSMHEKNVIMCVVRKQQAPKVEEIVREIDRKAFMIVTSATEIFGEGYKSFFTEKL